MASQDILATEVQEEKIVFNQALFLIAIIDLPINSRGIFSL